MLFKNVRMGDLENCQYANLLILFLDKNNIFLIVRKYHWTKYLTMIRFYHSMCCTKYTQRILFRSAESFDKYELSVLAFKPSKSLKMENQ